MLILHRRKIFGRRKMCSKMQ